MNQTELELKCRKENPELYYKAKELFRTDAKIARYLVQNSELFVSFNSWSMFMSLTMWSESNDKPTKPRVTQQQEFNRLIKEAINNMEKLDVKE